MLARDNAIDRLNEVFVVLATTNIRGLPTKVSSGSHRSSETNEPRSR